MRRLSVLCLALAVIIVVVHTGTHLLRLRQEWMGRVADCRQLSERGHELLRAECQSPDFATLVLPTLRASVLRLASFHWLPVLLCGVAAADVMWHLLWRLWLRLLSRFDHCRRRQ